MKKKFYFLLLCLLASLCGCKKDKEDDIVKRPYDRVIILGVDGAGDNYQYANTPNVDTIFSTGATTHRVKTSTPSMSAPCWTSMLHGVVPAKHKTTNTISETKPYQSPEYPSIFKVAHDQDSSLKLASFCNWSAINVGIVEDNIGVYKKQNSDDEKLAEELTNYIVEEQPNLVFVQFDSVDHAGHAGGFGPSNIIYIQHLEAIDAYIGNLFSQLETNNLLERTLILLCADHGGRNSSHGGISETEDFTFFGAWGYNIVKGEIGQMEVRDIAAIAAHALDLEKPSCWTAKVPDNLFSDVSGQQRPLGGELKNNNKSIDTLSHVSSYFDFETNYLDVKNKVKSSFSLFEGDTYRVLGHNGYGFNTYNGFMRLEDLQLKNNDFTLSMYIEMADVRNDPVLFGNKNWESGRNAGIIISPRGNEKDIKINIGNGSDRFDITIPFPETYLNKWTHLLFSFDRTNNNIDVYFDFEKVSSFSLPDTFKSYSLDSNYFYYVGNDVTENYGYGIPGIIDDLAIFDKALSSDEVKTLKDFYL